VQKKGDSFRLDARHNNILELLFTFGPMHITIIRNLYFLFFGDKNNMYPLKLRTLIDKNATIKLSFGGHFKFPRDYTGIDKRISDLVTEGYLKVYKDKYFECKYCKINKKSYHPNEIIFYKVIKSEKPKFPHLKTKLKTKIPYYPSNKLFEVYPFNYKNLSDNQMNYILYYIERELHYRIYATKDKTLIFNKFNSIYEVLKENILEDLVFYKYGHDVFGILDDFDEIYTNCQNMTENEILFLKKERRIKDINNPILSQNKVIYDMLKKRKRFLSTDELLELVKPFIIEIENKKQFNSFYISVYNQLTTLSELRKINLTYAGCKK